MTDIRCNYPDRDEQLVAYLYDDIDSTERTAFGLHLSVCRQCQDDLSALRGVRTALGTWAPPEPAFLVGASRAASLEPRVSRFEARVPSPEPRVPSPEARAWWHDVPAWAQVAAALFVLGVSATIANLDVRYDRSGLSIRTGWSKPQASAENAEPWRAELAALQSQVRTMAKQEASAVPAATEQPPSISEAELRRRVRMLLDERETRIQNEIALAVANVMKDY